MNLLKDLTVDALVSRLVAVLFFSAVLGFITALLARLLDDRRPQFAERLTINPFSHVSVSGALVAAVFCVGWIRTMPFDVKQNRWGAAGVLFAALAGLFLTALTIPLVDPLRSFAVNVLPQTGGYVVVYALIQYQELTLASCLLNLLPLPGLVCGAIWPAIWPGREKRINQIEPIALAVLAAIIVSGVIGNPVPALMPYFSALT
jgi:hypothetical protein